MDSQSKKLMEFKKLRQKKFINQDKIFLIYTAILLFCRLKINPLLLSLDLSQTKTTIIGFGISLIIVIIFILISDYYKLDWSEKTKKSLVLRIVNLAPKRLKVFLFFPLFFLFESFLLFVFYRNGSSRNKKRLKTAWVLLVSSLVFASLLWMKIGTIW